jgi:hypothetical protein
MSCHLLFFLGILLSSSAPLIFSSLQGISGQHIPEENIQLIQSKNGIAMVLKVNNMPLLFTTTSNF